MFGCSYEFEGGEGRSLRRWLVKVMIFLGFLTGVTFFSHLGCLDLQGMRKRCGILIPKINAFVGKIIEEHRLKMAKGQERYVSDFNIPK